LHPELFAVPSKIATSCEVINLTEEAEMKVLVACYSESGNTEKVAKAIYDGLGFVEKDFASIKDKPRSRKYDVIFVGFPVHNHGVPALVENFIKRIPEGKKVAFFRDPRLASGG
jgi:flavodoxin